MASLSRPNAALTSSSSNHGKRRTRASLTQTYADTHTCIVLLVPFSLPLSPCEQQSYLFIIYLFSQRGDNAGSALFDMWQQTFGYVEAWRVGSVWWVGGWCQQPFETVHNKGPRGLKANESGTVRRRTSTIHCVGADGRVKANEMHQCHLFYRTSTCISLRTDTKYIQHDTLQIYFDFFFFPQITQLFEQQLLCILVFLDHGKHALLQYEHKFNIILVY